MIELHDIHKSFGSLEVLKGIDLQIADHEITAIVGPSGAGKSTLLQIMGTLSRPNAGRILYDGFDVTSLSDRRLSAFRNSKIGFVFQFHQLLPELSALENVMLPARIAGTSRRISAQRAAELLELMGLEARAHHKPAQLSGGERQRVAVARALINNPEIIFADEPTGSLDSKNRDEIQALFRSLCQERGQTFVIVTHDSSLASVASRVVEMADGCIVPAVDTAAPAAEASEISAATSEAPEEQNP
jgi:lipoprotein-releasing system ATP-binding protein